MKVIQYTRFDRLSASKRGTVEIFHHGLYEGNIMVMLFECLVRNASPFLIVMWFLLEYDTSPMTPLLGHVMVKVIQLGLM